VTLAVPKQRNVLLYIMRRSTLFLYLYFFKLALGYLFRLNG